VRTILLPSVVLSLLLSSSLCAIEPRKEGSWVPVVEFELDDSDFEQTLAWVSGWSYALTAVAAEQASRGQERWFCPTDRGFVESRVMLTILNDQFKGRRVTANQAAAALWQGIRKAYPCKPAREA
jgi:hypothetical protein